MSSQVIIIFSFRHNYDLETLKVCIYDLAHNNIKNLEKSKSNLMDTVLYCQCAVFFNPFMTNSKILIIQPPVVRRHECLEVVNMGVFPNSTIPYDVNTA